MSIVKYTVGAVSATLGLIIIGAALQITNAESLPVRVSHSSVRLVGPMGEPHGSGSVVKYADKEVIITNWHVCESYRDKSNITLLIDDSFFLSKQITSDLELDLCAIEYTPTIRDFSHRIALELTDKPLRRFDKLMVLGYPLDSMLSPIFGYVLGPKRITIAFGYKQGKCLEGFREEATMFFTLCVKDYNLIVTNLQTFPGNSGSPVVNEQGELVGVINSGEGTLNYGNMILLEDLRKFLVRI